MKRIWSIVMLLALLLTGNAYAAEAGQETSGLTRDVVVLFTSDVHCGVDQNFGYVGL